MPKDIVELLDELAHKEWGGRSLMQEARLSAGLFSYHATLLIWPWAKQLSFVVGGQTYELLIPRKTKVNDTWVATEPAKLVPQVTPEHTTKVFEILKRVLDDKQALR